MKVASLVTPPGSGVCRDSVGFTRYCAEVVGVMVDDIVIPSRLATEVADEAAVGVCVGGSPIPSESRGPTFLSGFPCLPWWRNSRIRSRFLGFELDISRESAVLSSTGKTDGQ